MRCRELKKKCDNGTPSCARCLDFGAKCLYLTYEQYQRGLAESVNALGDELQEFESTIQRILSQSVSAQDDSSSSSSSDDSASDMSVSLMDELETELDHQEDVELSPNTRKFYQYLIINRVSNLATTSPASPDTTTASPTDPDRPKYRTKSALPWQMRVYHTGVSIQTNIQTFKDLHDLFKSHHPHHLP
ncbi:hypothetical protein Unana1_08091 [Umbelopsis nana]